MSVVVGTLDTRQLTRVLIWVIDKTVDLVAEELLPEARPECVWMTLV